MGRTLEDIIKSESPEVVQRAQEIADEQLVRLSVTKLLSNLGTGDVPAIAWHCSKYGVIYKNLSLQIVLLTRFLIISTIP